MGGHLGNVPKALIFSRYHVFLAQSLQFREQSFACVCSLVADSNAVKDDKGVNESQRADRKKVGFQRRM